MDAGDEGESCLPKKYGQNEQGAGAAGRMVAARIPPRVQICHAHEGVCVLNDAHGCAGVSRKSVVHSKVVAMRAFNGIMGALRRHREAPSENGDSDQGPAKASRHEEPDTALPIVTTQGFTAMDIEELGGRLRQYEASQESVKGWGRLREAVGVGNGNCNGEAHSMHHDAPAKHQPAKQQSVGLDEELAKREEVGAPVLENLSTLDTEWNLPDLALIFRPPTSIIKVMSVGISPGQWIKLAPDPREEASKWGTLRNAMQTGIAFKVTAREGEMASEEEAASRRLKAQMDVEAFKQFLLNITRAWDELMASESDQLSCIEEQLHGHQDWAARRDETPVGACGGAAASAPWSPFDGSSAAGCANSRLSHTQRAGSPSPGGCFCVCDRVGGCFCVSYCSLSRGALRSDTGPWIFRCPASVAAGARVPAQGDAA